MYLLQNISKAGMLGTLIALISLFNLPYLYAQSEVDSKVSQPNIVKTDSIAQVVNNYSQGFVDNNFNTIRNSIGEQLIMVNGNYSGNPVDWQAHQFLDKKEIDDWITMMLANAKPFENTVDIINVNFRGNSAVVVTLEKGKNHFRTWKNEEVAYMLGNTPQGWKIIGIFIKNLRNPD